MEPEATSQRLGHLRILLSSGVGEKSQLARVDLSCPLGTWTRTWPRPAAADRHSLDLDQLVGIAEDRDAQQRARRVMIAEGIADDPPGGQQVGGEPEATYTVVLATSVNPAPAAPSVTARLAITC